MPISCEDAIYKERIQITQNSSNLGSFVQTWYTYKDCRCIDNQNISSKIPSGLIWTSKNICTKTIGKKSFYSNLKKDLSHFGNILQISKPAWWLWVRDLSKNKNCSTKLIWHLTSFSKLIRWGKEIKSLYAEINKFWPFCKNHVKIK